MAAMDGPDEFTDEHRSVLDFEKHWWRHQGNKAAQIQARLSLTPARYYRLLNAAIDHPDSLAYDPMLVKRLRRLREVRKARRRRSRAQGDPTALTPGSDRTS